MGPNVIRDWLLVPLGYTLILVSFPFLAGSRKGCSLTEWSLEGVEDSSEEEHFTNFSKRSLHLLQLITKQLHKKKKIQPLIIQNISSEGTCSARMWEMGTEISTQ